MQVEVDGELLELDANLSKSLLAVLREDAGITSVKEGCSEGECGTCALWMDGLLVNSCLVLASRANGSEIRTVASLGATDELHPVQRSLLEHGAVQCGFCTPGVVAALVDLQARVGVPTRDDVLEALAGHLCRCTGYVSILEAALSVTSNSE